MAIHFLPDAGTFKLDTRNTSYIMGLTQEGYLGHLYYGPYLRHPCSMQGFRLKEYPSPAVLRREKLAFMASFPYEYPTAGVGDYRESCLDVENSEGMSGCELFYESFHVSEGKPMLEGLPASFAGQERVQTLVITLRDRVIGLKVDLLYSVFPEEDVITRAVVIYNEGEETICLRRAMSAGFDMDNRSFEMIGLFGAWARERHVERIPLHHGRQVISSSRGESSPQESPFIALVNEDTSQTQGEVYGINLVYSGNFEACVDVSMYDSVRVVMGINPSGFRWNLEKGERFTTPEIVLTYSGQGIDQMTLNYHHFYREHLIRNPYRGKLRPVLINNWEGTFMDFDQDRLYAIAEDASRFGIDMFVMDDGWFGERNDDNHGLGDWAVNEKKLKGGLKALVDRVSSLGMKFGIWIEPEMVNEESDLYREHPDWVIALPGRDPSRQRNQLVLDIQRKEVRDHVMDQIIRVLHSAPIDYVKWDMNRYLSDVGSATLPKERQGELLHRYTLAVYEMEQRLLDECPGILLENCSSGGARFDPGMLYYSPQIWCSDDTDAIERLRIQEGTAMVYPISTIGAHVSLCPNAQVGRITPVETRANVAMAGTFGYELVLSDLSKEERNLIEKQVERYHRFHMLCEEGDYYRLCSWSEKKPLDAWIVVSRDRREALLTCVQVLGVPNWRSERLILKGLDSDRNYRITVESGDPDSLSVSACFGEELMNAGLLIPSMRDFCSLLIHLKEAEER